MARDAKAKTPKKRKSRATGKPRGRPPGQGVLYTPELAQTVLDRLSSGTPMAEIARDKEGGMPSVSLVRNWRNEMPDFDAAYAQARADGFDQIALDALRIADTPLLMEDSLVEQVTTSNTAGQGQNAVTVTKTYTKRSIRKSDAYQHRRLQVETRLRLLRAWDPKRYGDLSQRPAAPGENDGAGTLRVIIEGGLPSAEELAMDADMVEPAAPGPPGEPGEPEEPTG
jgi:hypothetical protein